MNEFYKPEFGIKVDKLSKGDWQLGLFLNHRLWHHYHNEKVGALGDIKEIFIHNQLKDNRGLFINYSPENNGAYLNLNELQAIYNKCKELGWFDDKN